jgi:hypothetical protein
MQEKYHVMLGDVVSSRTIADRPNFQKKLENACNDVNLNYRNDIFAEFKISKGTDEIAGVLVDISNIFKIITLFFDYLYPYQIRFALVYDYIDVSMDIRDVTKMDGPAFHKASSDINELKLIGTSFKFSVYDLIVDSAIENEINLLFMIKSDWSLLQHNIIKEYMKLGKQTEVANKLGTSQTFVSRTIHKLRWKELSYIEENLNYMLLRYQQRLLGRNKIGCSSIDRNSDFRA